MMSNLKRSSTTRRILHAASSERLQAVAEPRCWPYGRGTSSVSGKAGCGCSGCRKRERRARA